MTDIIRFDVSAKGGGMGLRHIRDAIWGAIAEILRVVFH
jgi:hypothetical protein